LKVRQATEKVPRAVILSEAKDLHLVVFKKILQMLRFAQHDTVAFHATCSTTRLLDFSTFDFRLSTFDF